jgi:hypothetical protein
LRERRGSLTLWVSDDAIAAWAPANTGRRGRPRDYSDVAIETGLMLRLAFGRPWRQTEGLLGSILGLLGLELPVPDHTTLSRRCSLLSTMPPNLRQSHLRIARNIFSLDSGFQP